MAKGTNSNAVKKVRPINTLKVGCSLLGRRGGFFLGGFPSKGSEVNIDLDSADCGVAKRIAIETEQSCYLAKKMPERRITRIKLSGISPRPLVIAK